MDGKKIDGQRIVVEKTIDKRKVPNSTDNTKEKHKGPQSKDVCFNCGVAGHWQDIYFRANECREPIRPFVFNRNELICFNCQRKGHVVRDCIEKYKTKKENDQGVVVQIALVIEGDQEASHTAVAVVETLAQEVIVERNGEPISNKYDII